MTAPVHADIVEIVRLLALMRAGNEDLCRRIMWMAADCVKHAVESEHACTVVEAHANIMGSRATNTIKIRMSDAVTPERLSAALSDAARKIAAGAGKHVLLASGMQYMPRAGRRGREKLRVYWMPAGAPPVP